MAIYRALQVSFWQDEFVIELTPEEKFFYVYLMTNSKTAQCGIFYQSKKLIEVEIGYSRDTIDKLIDRFISYGKILYSPSTKEFMIVNWIKHNFINSKNTITCINKELKSVKDKTFINRFYKQCEKYGYPLEAIFKDIEISDLNTVSSLEDAYTYTPIVEELLIRDYEGASKTLGEKEKEKELQKEKQLQNLIENIEDAVVGENDTSTVTFGKVVDFFNNNIHMITPCESEKLISWSKDIDCELLLMAAKEAVNHNARNMSYINGILCNWATLGLTTAKSLQDYKDQRISSKKSEDKTSITNAQAYEYVD